MFKDYEMTLYAILGVLFALSVLVAVLDKKISHGIFFFLFAVLMSVILMFSLFISSIMWGNFSF